MKICTVITDNESFVGGYMKIERVQCNHHRHHRDNHDYLSLSITIINSNNEQTDHLITMSHPFLLAGKHITDSQRDNYGT